jgi:hypothetical protein
MWNELQIQISEAQDAALVPIVTEMIDAFESQNVPLSKLLDLIAIAAGERYGSEPFVGLLERSARSLKALERQQQD